MSIAPIHIGNTQKLEAWQLATAGMTQYTPQTCNAWGERGLCSQYAARANCSISAILRQPHYNDGAGQESVCHVTYLGHGL